MKTLKSFFNPLNAIIGGVLFLVGCPFFGVGVYEAVEAQQQNQTFTAVTGIVVDNHYQTTYNNGNVEGAYYPLVEFTDATGEKVRFTDGAGSLPPDYEVGDQVPVLYNPEDVQEARLNTWKRVWFVPTLLMCIGGLPILAFAIWILVSTSVFSTGQRNV